MPKQMFLNNIMRFAIISMIFKCIPPSYIYIYIEMKTQLDCPVSGHGKDETFQKEGHLHINGKKIHKTIQI